MAKVVIVYDSVTGNTESMAKAIAEGVSSVKSTEVESHKVGTPFSISALNEADAIVIGSPTEYGNVSSSMKAFLESVNELAAAKKLRLRGKVGGVFGSYGWDGGWVVDMLAMRMKKLGLRVVPNAVSAVDQEGQAGRISQKHLEECRELGKAVATKI